MDKKTIALSASLFLAGCVGLRPSIDNDSVYGTTVTPHTRINFSSGRVYGLQNACANTSCHPMLKTDGDNYTVHPRPLRGCLASFKEQQAIKMKHAPKAINPYACDCTK